MKHATISRLKYLLLLLLLIPLCTEYIEERSLPQTLTDWTTEAVMTLIIGATIIIIFRQIKYLERISLIDHLTGIGNRRQFDIDLKREILRAERYTTGVVLIFFDLDGFKKINDTYGHEAGDQVLIRFARELTKLVRKGSDYCYRFGGDEFAILATEIKSGEISSIEDKIEQRVRAILLSDMDVQISASKGLVVLQENESYDEFMKRADDEMFHAKRKKKRR